MQKDRQSALFFSSPRSEGHNHANIARHLTGVRPGYSREIMEKKFLELLSVNYVQTLPNTQRQAKPKSRAIFGTLLS